MSKRDDVSLKYNYSKRIQKLSGILFYLNFLSSIMTLFFYGEVKDKLILLQIVLAIIMTVLSLIDDDIFWYNAEFNRRKSAVEHAFEIDLTGLKTEEYYNNSIKPSMKKYIVNIFESVFFTKNILEKMILGSLIKVVLILIVFIIACIEFENGEALLLIAQTFLSGNYIVGFIKQIICGVRIKNLYERFYNSLVTVGVTSSKQQNSLFSDALEYEAVKAHYKVRLSSRVFSKLNEKLSSDWEEIENKIKFQSKK